MKHIPKRTCISCKVKEDKNKLIKIVKYNNIINVDKWFNLPGRSAYVCNNTECINKMIINKGLNRSFRSNIKIDYERLGVLLDNKRVLGLLGLAAKQRKIESGSDAVENSLKKGKANKKGEPKLVIIADDASNRTKERFKFLSHKNNVKWLIFENIENLSKAIGKHNKAIIAVLNEEIANQISNILEVR